MINVAQLTAGLDHCAAGVGESVRGLSGALAKRPGLAVAVFGLAPPASWTDLRHWRQSMPKVYRVAGSAAFGYAPELVPDLLGADLDLVHTHGLWMYPSLAATRWASRTGRPYVVTPHGMLDPWALGRSRWKKRLAAYFYESRHLRGAGCVHVLSRGEASSARAFGIAGPLAVISWGVDLPPASSVRVAGWSAGLPQGTRVLLYLGRLHEKKGLANLLLAWQRARGASDRHEWRLVLAGWGEPRYVQRLQALCADVGAADSVRFVGPQFGEDRDATYRAAQALVLPSYSEGTPMVVLEAWSYGLPVLMTPQCNLPEGFDAGAAIPIGTDVDAIAAGFHAVMAQSAAERQTMGARGRRLVETRFSWERMAGEMHAVYTWLLGGGARPDCVCLE